MTLAAYAVPERRQHADNFQIYIDNLIFDDIIDVPANQEGSGFLPALVQPAAALAPGFCDRSRMYVTGYQLPRGPEIEHRRRGFSYQTNIQALPTSVQLNWER